MGELQGHVPQSSETNHADFLSWADFPVAERGVGGDAGAEKGGRCSRIDLIRDLEDEALVCHDLIRVTAKVQC